MANKAFPQFTKTIVQLPIPSATMTKAEYKAKYGIDLNAIDFPKIIILVDGKDKYPVDEIRVVSTTTEIYAGGKILSIGSTNVSVTSDAYSVANAKPIYCHPIILRDDGTGTIRVRLTGLIFNNDSTAFTKSSFYQWLKDLMVINPSAKILINGVYFDGTNSVITSYLNYNTSTLKTNIVGLLADGSIGTKTDDFENIFPASIIFEDGVNKIN